MLLSVSFISLFPCSSYYKLLCNICFDTCCINIFTSLLATLHYEYSMWSTITCLYEAISLKFQHKLSADEDAVTSEHHQIQTIAHPSKLGQTRLWGTGYELGHSSRRCWELKLCHRRDGKKQGGSSILTAAGLVELRMAFSHVAALYLVCLATISHSLSRVQPCLALTVGSIGVNQRSVFWSLPF